MSKNTMTGFTLIEMLIVLAIMGILGAAASYFYGNSAMKAGRSDAKSGLQNVATTLGKCKSLYGSYNSPNCSISNGDSVDSPGGKYSIAITSAASTFALKATPAAGSPQEKDTDCTSLSLTNLNVTSATGAKPLTCW